MSTKVKATSKTNTMKYIQLITRTESDINKELLDLEVAKAANVLQQGTLSVQSKVLAAEGEVKQAEITVGMAKQALEDSKASKPFNVQNILNKRTAYLQAEEDLKTQQETATQIKDSHTFLVQLAEELF
jgi:aspartyl-tRNA synthetase